MKTAFMFSGQGAEKVGMCQDLYNEFSEIKDTFDIASKSLGFDLAEICFNDEEKMKDTEYVQPALVTVSTGILSLIEKEGITPDYLLGLSLGEYSAFVASGALDFAETVKLVNTRGQLMKEAFVGLDCAMTAVLNTSIDVIKDVVKEASAFGVLEVANYNTSKQIVISGEVKALEVAEKLFVEQKVKFIRLGVRGAFHTSLLDNAAIKLNKELNALTLNDIKIPVVVNKDASIFTNKEDIVENLTLQLKSSVMFEQSIKNLIDNGVTRFVEIGVGKTLTSFVKKIDKSVEVIHIDSVETLKKALEILK